MEIEPGDQIVINAVNEQISTDDLIAVWTVTGCSPKLIRAKDGNRSRSFPHSWVCLYAKKPEDAP